MNAAVVGDALQACVDAALRVPGVERCDAEGGGAEGGPSRLRLRARGLHVWDLSVLVEREATRLPLVGAHGIRRPLAHVGHDGTVCIDDGEGLSYDPCDTPALVDHVVRQALRLLDESAEAADTGRDDALLEEIEGYWSSLPAVAHASTDIDIDSQARLIQVDFVGAGKPCDIAWLTGLAPSEKIRHRSVQIVSRRGAYLPLDEAILPPAPGSMLDAQAVNHYLDSLPAASAAIVLKLAGKKHSTCRASVLFSQRRPGGGRAAFGMTFMLKGARAAEGTPVVPFTVQRCSGDYLRERGGAHTSLAQARVAVLGCGSLGSEVADALASCGVGQFCLVDPQTLSWDNVFRHALGASSVGRPKARELAADLQRRYPGLQAKAHVASAQQWLGRDGVASGIGAAVVATGQPALDRILARKLLDLPAAPAVVTTWIEALGLGGHAIGSCVNEPGCLDCLHHDIEGQSELWLRTAFIEPQQKVSRNLTGCAGAFTPYGALHSRQTALLAAAMTVDFLLGRRQASYRFWRGDAAAACAAGVRTTVWFDRVADCSALAAERAVLSVRCPRCAALSR